MGEEHRVDVTRCDVEFLGDDATANKNCLLVHHLMKTHGMRFEQAVDYMELRRDTHWRIVNGPTTD